jgi:hypothetical protein
VRESAIFSSSTNGATTVCYTVSPTAGGRTVSLKRCYGQTRGTSALWQRHGPPGVQPDGRNPHLHRNSAPGIALAHPFACRLGSRHAAPLWPEAPYGVGHRHALGPLWHRSGHQVQQTRPMLTFGFLPCPQHFDCSHLAQRTLDQCAVKRIAERKSGTELFGLQRYCRRWCSVPIGRQCPVPVVEFIKSGP